LKKARQKLFYAGSWAKVLPTPTAQGQKSFLLLFFKKEALPSLNLPRGPGRAKRRTGSGREVSANRRAGLSLDLMLLWEVVFA